VTAIPEAWGPWAPNLPEPERIGRLRSLQTLVRVFAGPDHPFAAALANAETDPAAAAAAWTALNTVPAVPRRKILATFAAVNRPLSAR
jgi:hypothetical protein